MDTVGALDPASGASAFAHPNQAIRNGTDAARNPPRKRRDCPGAGKRTLTMYDAKEARARADRLSHALPKPTGYMLLVAPLKVKEKTDGGIIRPDMERGREELAAPLGLVIRMGEQAYKDERRFAYEWCGVGDIVAYRPYSGTRIKVSGEEFRLISDDTVEAVVPTVEGYERA